MAETQLIVVPALFMGAAIGIIELFFVHQDERGMGWLGHGLHAIPATMFFTFVSMNVAWGLGLIGQQMAVTGYVEFGVRAFIAIIAMLKVSAAAAIVGRVGEKFHHTLMIGAIIFAAPYFWDFAGESLIKMMPFLDYRIG
ncbi:hypothetical protein HY640_02650 [Candidatus Woesearchaeota archaeon]|nr:hypothetical protein [Candidatus Woesearchaeota archaeon]